MDGRHENQAGRRWLLACAAVAAGEFAASRVPQAADAWPAVAIVAALVAVFGYGACVRCWRYAFLFFVGAALFLHASVEYEQLYRERPWMRGRPERMVRGGRDGGDRMAAARAALARNATLGLSHDCGAVALNRAILLGERGRLPRRIRRVFATSGTMHVFAVSGVHVMAVAQVLAILLRMVFFVPRRLAGVAAVPALWGYVFVIGAPPSAVRAAMMASLCFLASLFWRRPNATTAWSLTFLAVCGVNPRMIADVGCMLSFTVMLGIILAGDCLRGRGSVASLLWMTLVAWAAGVPITARVFGHVTPGGLLANLVLIPAAGVAVAAGAVGMLAGFLSESLAIHFNNLAALATSAMAGVSEVVSRMSLADFEVRPWPVSACAAWYAGILLLLHVASRRRDGLLD